MQKNKKDFSLDIEKAMKRAALRAREIALQTKTPIIVELNGKIKSIAVTHEDVNEYIKFINSCK
jgi:uncharacterized protein YabE (DUF348 family)